MIRPLLLALALAAPAAAQEAQRPLPGPVLPGPVQPGPVLSSAVLPGIGSHDPRRRVDAQAAPWRALGRVQTELGGRCTGVLVAPDRVLTAAHCLVAPRSGNFVQARSVHFLLGYHQGAWVAAARVTSFTRGPDYQPRRGPTGADWAVLVLERPVGTPDRILPLLRETPPPRSAVMLGGYQQDRPEMLMADTDCRLIGLQRPPSGTPVLVHDCAGTRGSSGAPLLARRPDGAGWGVIGVQSASAADLAMGQAAPASAVEGVAPGR